MSAMGNSQSPLRVKGRCSFKLSKIIVQLQLEIIFACIVRLQKAGSFYHMVQAITILIIMHAILILVLPFELSTAIVIRH